MKSPAHFLFSAKTTAYTRCNRNVCRLFLIYYKIYTPAACNTAEASALFKKRCLIFKDRVARLACRAEADRLSCCELRVGDRSHFCCLLRTEHLRSHLRSEKLSDIRQLAYIVLQLRDQIFRRLPLCVGTDCTQIFLCSFLQFRAAAWCRDHFLYLCDDHFICHKYILLSFMETVVWRSVITITDPCPGYQCF